MESPLTERIQTLLADVFKVPVQEVTPDLAMGDLPQWDSIGHMDIMLSLEQNFGVEITTEAIGELVSIPAIYTYLMDKSNYD
jgi:acyl carrier protein